MNTKQKGNLSELSLCRALIAAGYTVSFPYGDNARYDLIIDKDGSLNRVQVKTGNVKGDCVHFHTTSVNCRTADNSNYQGQIEYFGVYVPELDHCYLIPIADAPAYNMTLRLRKSTYNLTVGVNWAEDYKL